jgi:two-component system, OmpR family, phosphate regulon sensor histidine kinase PhoR
LTNDLRFWAVASSLFAALAALVAAILVWGGIRSFLDPGWLLLAAAGSAALAGALVQRSLLAAHEECQEKAILAETAGRELERHRNALDVLAEGLAAGIFVCDEKGVVLYANGRAEEMFRFENPVGRSILAVSISFELEQIVLEAARSAQPRERELTFQFPDEHTAFVRAWKEPEGGRVFVSLYDITDLKRLERVRSDFVANVSHELRTPLAAIRSLAETLVDEPDASFDKRKDYLTRIVDEVDRLAMIVSDLLILSTAELNPVRKQGCDLAAVLRSSIKLLAERAAEKGLELEYQVPDSFPIEANPIQMEQVFVNLIANAIQYTPKGTVRVRLGQKGESAAVSVSDTGLGIPSEDIPRIFERFYRVDKGRSRAVAGTGLGLSIVKHIVEAHGGSVEVESKLNEGSTFTICLPIGEPSFEEQQPVPLAET